MDARQRDAQQRQTAAADRLRRQFSGEREVGDTGGGGGGAAFAGVGIQFAVALVVFTYLGQWLDRRLGTAPVFLLGGVFVGGGLAFYAMYSRLTAAQRREDAARAARRAQQPLQPPQSGNTPDAGPENLR